MKTKSLNFLVFGRGYYLKNSKNSIAHTQRKTYSIETIGVVSMWILSFEKRESIQLTFS